MPGKVSMDQIIQGSPNLRARSIEFKSGIKNGGQLSRPHPLASNVDLLKCRCYDLTVRLELPVPQYVRYLKQSALTALLALVFISPLQAQSQRPNLPDPIKFIDKFDKVMNAVRAVLVDMGFKIELEDRQAGKITTRPYEFITGSLTSSEVDKVAIKRDTVIGSWMKAQYSVEAVVEIVSPTETMVTIRTKMEALNRNVDGTEKWVPLESLGTYERRILGKISTTLMGKDAPFEEKKGFWDKKPQPVDPRQPRLPSR